MTASRKSNIARIQKETAVEVAARSSSSHRRSSRSGLVVVVAAVVGAVVVAVAVAVALAVGVGAGVGLGVGGVVLVVVVVVLASTCPKGYTPWYWSRESQRSQGSQNMPKPFPRASHHSRMNST